MRPDRAARPFFGVGRRRPRRADRARGPAPPRSGRRPTLASLLVWLVAALLAPPTALALAATAWPLSADVSPGPQVRTAAGRLPATGRVPAIRVPPMLPPVAGPLVRAFEAPAGRYGPGHRGVDLAAAPGATVRAPAPGRVAFAGSVAGTMWASIEVAPGVVATFGPLGALAVTRGQQVATGIRVAELAPGHGSAAHPTTLHLGLRVDGEYIDPYPWLTGFGRPRLAPLLQPGGPH